MKTWISWPHDDLTGQPIPWVEPPSWPQSGCNSPRDSRGCYRGCIYNGHIATGCRTWPADEGLGWHWAELKTR